MDSKLKQDTVLWAFLIFLGLSVTSVGGQWVSSCARQVSWSVLDAATNKSCILMTGNYYLLVPYIKAETAKSATAIVPISLNATVTGTCGTNSSKEQSMTLTWPVPTPTGTNETSPVNNVVTLKFTKNSTTGTDDGISGYFCLQDVKAVLHSNPVEFSGSTEPAKIHTLEAKNMEILATPLKNSYFCSSLQEYPVGEGALRLEHAQFEVFHDAPLDNDGLDFSPRAYCFADGLRMLITATALIIILVSAASFVIYLFRRKSKKAEYGTLD